MRALARGAKKLTVELERSVLDVNIKDDLDYEARCEHDQNGVVEGGILKQEGRGSGEHDAHNAAEAGSDGESRSYIFVFRLFSLQATDNHHSREEKDKRCPCTYGDVRSYTFDGFVDGEFLFG